MRPGNHTIDESRQGEALEARSGGTQKLYLESYGCQMNFSDSEIVASILVDAGYSTTKNESEADLILLNTCSIRDNAEKRIRHRLQRLKGEKKGKPKLKVGILGCMAERLKKQLLEEEKLVDLVVGPDAYRDLPRLVGEIEGGQKAVNTLLSREETYADIEPVRLYDKGVTGFISIMRGCDNMCSFCVVPFTRGRERSRDPKSIVAEAHDLFNKGHREVTLLGQNVDSYKWNVDAKGVVKNEDEPVVRFAQLMALVSEVNPDLRIRFSTSHPKDMTDEVLEVMATRDNLCKYIHLPVQSGDSDVLKRMNRGYTRELYLDRIAAIRRIMPDCAISTDVIAGFCGETLAQHEGTLSLMNEVRYEMAYMFKYSERPRTLAERKFEDDVPEEEKSRRLAEIIALQKVHSKERTTAQFGKTYRVLVEGPSKRDPNDFQGRNTYNSVVVFPKGDSKPGEYVYVRTTSHTPVTLIGERITEAEAKAEGYIA